MVAPSNKFRFDEMIGKTLGKCKILKRGGMGKNNRPKYIVQCLSCGQTREVGCDNLTLVEKGKVSGQCSKCANEHLFGSKSPMAVSKFNPEPEPDIFDAIPIPESNNFTFTDMMSMYIINHNKEVINQEISKASAKVIDAMKQKAISFLSKKLPECRDGNFDGFLKETIQSQEFLDSFLAGNEVVKTVTVEVKKEVEVLPKDIASSIEDYLGILGETKNTVLKHIIQEYKDLEDILGTTEVTDKVKKLIEEKNEFKSKVIDKPIIHNSKPVVTPTKLPEPSVIISTNEQFPLIPPFGNDMESIDEAQEMKDKLNIFYSYTPNKDKVLSKIELMNFVNNKSKFEDTFEQLVDEGVLKEKGQGYIYIE